MKKIITALLLTLAFSAPIFADGITPRPAFAGDIPIVGLNGAHLSRAARVMSRLWAVPVAKVAPCILTLRFTAFPARGAPQAVQRPQLQVTRY